MLVGWAESARPTSSDRRGDHVIRQTAEILALTRDRIRDSGRPRWSSGGGPGRRPRGGGPVPLITRADRLACHNYEAVHGTLPPAVVYGPDGTPLYSSAGADPALHRAAGVVRPVPEGRAVGQPAQRPSTGADADYLRRAGTQEITGPATPHDLPRLRRKGSSVRRYERAEAGRRLPGRALEHPALCGSRRPGPVDEAGGGRLRPGTAPPQLERTLQGCSDRRASRGALGRVDSSRVSRSTRTTGSTGFHEVEVDAGLVRPAAVVVGRAPGHRDQERPLTAVRRREPAGQLPPVHAGHLEVEEHGVQGVGGRRSAGRPCRRSPPRR